MSEVLTAEAGKKETRRWWLSIDKGTPFEIRPGLIEATGGVAETDAVGVCSGDAMLYCSDGSVWKGPMSVTRTRELPGPVSSTAFWWSWHAQLTVDDGACARAAILAARAR